MTRDACPKCRAIHAKGGSEAWGPFFFVCSSGHLTSLTTQREQLAIVPNMSRAMLREALHARGVNSARAAAVRDAIKKRLRSMGERA